MVSKGVTHATPRDVVFRDTNYFMAGELSNHQFYWESILEQNPKKDEILSYIAHGVVIQDFFVPFKGDFQGKYYDSATPPAVFFFPTVRRVQNLKSSFPPLSLTVLRTVPYLFGDKLALLTLLIWSCQSP